MKPSRIERFEDKFCPEPNSGCWLWLASNLKDRYGKDSYGVFGWERSETILAHRAAWLLYRKTEIPEGIDVMHRCDNRLCVNPDHLRLGTRLDNMRDAKEKRRVCAGNRRARISSQTWTKHHKVMFEARPRGDGHECSKLTSEQVYIIRSTHRQTAALALRFGVSETTIKKVRSRLSWKHLP